MGHLAQLKDRILRSPHHSATAYDCILHLTGSRASLFQLHLLVRSLGLKPLTVTFNHGAMSDLERYHLDRALEVYDVDHIQFNPRKSILNRFRKEGPEVFANAAQAGMLDFTFRCARMYGVPIVVLDTGTVWPSKINPVTWLGLGFDHLDLRPYRFDLGSHENLEIFSLTEEPSDARNFFESEFPWADEAALTRRKTHDEKKWHEIEGRRKTTSERNPNRFRTQYEELAAKATPGVALFAKELRYCARCCMPETAEALAFDELGMCQPCRSSEQKMHINWVEREQKLRKILADHRSTDGANYDLVVPISGGKDSTFQLYVLTQNYGLRPLAVTFSHNWYTEVGKKNLTNSCDQFDVDHVIFTPRRKVINLLARKSLYMIGDSCWHCHSGVGSFPLFAAAKFEVPLLVWGESVSERDGRATYEKPILFDRDYFTKISARFYAEQMVDEELSLFDVKPYTLPSHEELTAKAVRGIHLGDYIFWDDERQTEFVRDYWGWLESDVEGAYKGFKSVECRMAGVHDYSKFVKRGFGRGTDQASLDVRAGLMTREEGFEIARRYDSERPDALDFYLEITGYNEEEFERILKEKRDGKAKNLP